MAEIVAQALVAIVWTGFIALQFYRKGFHDGLHELERQYLEKKGGPPKGAT